jgi:hypothetical protein
MPRVRDLLYRFRPAGAPGAATAAGVPADRSADLAAELEPLFALLASTEQECAEIGAAATRELPLIRAKGAERARGVIADATARSQAERAAVTAQLRQRVESESAQLLVAAEREAAGVRELADGRMPEFTARIVGEVRQMLGESGENR